MEHHDLSDGKTISRSLSSLSTLSPSPSRSPSPPITKKSDPWGVLMSRIGYSAAYEKQQRTSKGLFSLAYSLFKNEYIAGRSRDVDIRFNEGNTDSTTLPCISKKHFIIRRERVTNYETADYEGDFVVVIYDTSSHGTFVNKSKLINKKGILAHNDTISIAGPNYEVFTYSHHTSWIELPSKLAENYVGLRTLGEGMWGVVQLVYCKKNYRLLALKSLEKPTDASNIMNEVKMLQKVEHINIVKMMDVIDTPSTLFCCLEVMLGGNLKTRIEEMITLPEKLAKFYFYQIATAVKYLHDKKITHGDLKLENILLLDNENYTLVKVTDFGMSKLINHETMDKGFYGTPYYAAPETFQIKRSSEYTSQVDIWRLGVMLYVMLSSCLPFKETENQSLGVAILEGNYCFPQDKFASVSKEAKELIDLMLVVTPSTRHTISNVVASSWLDDEELKTSIAVLLKPYLNFNNNDNSENQSSNGSNCDNRDGSSSHDVKKKRRLE